MRRRCELMQHCHESNNLTGDGSSVQEYRQRGTFGYRGQRLPRDDAGFCVRSNIGSARLQRSGILRRERLHQEVLRRK